MRSADMKLPFIPERALFSNVQALALTVTVISQVVIGAEAQALEFNFGFSEGTPDEVIQGFDAAGDLWSSFLIDDVTVNITVQFEALTNSSLGRFEPQRANYTYRDVVGALGSDITSLNDAIAYTNLPKSADFEVLLDPEFDILTNGTADNPNGVGSDIPYLDDDGDCNNESIRITTGNAKALGLPVTGSGSCGPGSLNDSEADSDGTILLNSLFNWDFDATDGIDAERYDFVGVAAQGIAVMLGFISGVDVLDLNSPLIQEDASFFFEDGMFPFVSILDLYRFSEDSVDLDVIDWTTGRLNQANEEVDKYFSIDGGQTKIASFSTGILDGDGYRASSWKADELSGNYVGLLEPTPAQGQLLQFSDIDQVAFDVIGWDLADAMGSPPGRDIRDGDGSGGPPNSGGGSDNPASVPEPSSVLALIPIGWVGIQRLLRGRRERSSS